MLNPKQRSSSFSNPADKRQVKKLLVVRLPPDESERLHSFSEGARLPDKVRIHMPRKLHVGCRFLQDPKGIPEGGRSLKPLVGMDS